MGIAERFKEAAAAAREELKNKPPKEKKKPIVFKGNTIDIPLVLMTTLLVVFGLLMVFTASSYVAAAGDKYNHDSMFFLKRQLVFAVAGIVIMLGLGRFLPVDFLDRIRWILMGISSILMFLLLTQEKVNGARRWIKLFNDRLSIQPAEFLKASLIIFLAVAFTKYRSSLYAHSLKGFWLTLLPAFYSGLLVFVISRNLSSAIIVVLIFAVMSFAASVDYAKYILAIIVIIIAALAVHAHYSKIVENAADIKSEDFRENRLLAWVDPEADAQDKGMQTLQSLFAVGSGGKTGKGFGQSVQKMGFIPEPYNDMIFAIICEELGLVGAGILIVLYIGLLARMMMIALRTRNVYRFLLVVGVMAHIASQAILNIAVVTNVIPNTGIGLPFVSYGGSAILVLLAEMGIVLAVNRENEFDREQTELRRQKETEA